MCSTIYKLEIQSGPNVLKDLFNSITMSIYELWFKTSNVTE